LQRRAAATLLLCTLSWLPLSLHAQSDTVDAHVKAAESALAAHDYQTAAGEYVLAAELSENADIARQATRVAYSYKLNDQAMRAAKRWSILEPDNEEALLYIAQLYLRDGDIRRSHNQFQDLLERGDEPVDQRLLSLIPVLSRENPDDAYALIQRLAKPYRDSAFANYAVAVLALQADDPESAAERAKEAIDIDAEWVKPHLLYARSLLLAGDEEGAIDYASRLIGDDPDPDPEARLELAIMLVSAGRDDDALSQVNQILLEQPYRTDALRLMAIINFRLERLDVAQSDFEELLASGNYRMDALYYLGRIADMREETEDAIDFYSEVTNGSNAVIAQSRVAGLLATVGKEDQALEHLTRFAEINPYYAMDMLRAKGQLLAELDRHDEALEYLDQAIEYQPDNESLRLGKGDLLIRSGRIDDAIETFREAAKLWPDSAMSLNALGYTLADRTTRYREAARLIKKALKIEPHSPAIIDSWGWVLFKQGKHEDALEQLEKAYESLRDPEVAAHIVEVLFTMERDAEAAAQLAEAELLFPDSDVIASVKERFLPGNN